MLKQVLKARGWTAYRLAKESGLTVPAVYRLARQKVQLGRVEGDTLNRFCAALECQPGDLLEYIPDKPKRKRG
jgi:putative transcriptional regulator